MLVDILQAKIKQYTKQHLRALKLVNRTNTVPKSRHVPLFSFHELEHAITLWIEEAFDIIAG